jgi:WD40 repeat protein
MGHPSRTNDEEGAGSPGCDGEHTERSPYQGLAYYTEDDARWFFGRDLERKRIISNLRTSRLTILYAESGVGKSSLLRAGVVARLRKLAEQGVEQRGSAKFVPIVFSDWQDEPIDRLIAAIDTQAAPFRVPVKARAMALHDASLAEGERRAQALENGDSAPVVRADDLARAVARTADAVDSTLLVILDQFEEHFRYRLDQSSPERLANGLATCVNAQGLPIHFLIAVREDAYGGLGDFFRERVANVYRNYIHLEYLSRAAAREAIERPLDPWNEDHPRDPPIKIGEGLSDAVLKEVWRGNLVLGPEPDQAGATESPSSPSSDEIEAPFLQLVMEEVWKCERRQESRELRKETLEVTLGGAERIVRHHLDNALKRLTAEERVSAKLIFRELVTPSGAKVAHSAADLVGFTERPEKSVASALRKLDNERIVREVDAAPGSTATRYEIFHDRLAAAILEWLAQQKTEQLRSDKERAEKDKQRAEQEKRRQEVLARRFKLMAIGLGVLLLIMGGLTFYAWRQTVKANNETTRAAYFGLTTRAQSQLSSRPDLALLLFLAAYSESPQPLAERSLVATLQEVEMSGASGILHGHTDAIEGLAFSPRQPLLASASGDGTIRLWHVNRNGHYPVGAPLKAGGPVLSVAFSPDGQSLASGSFNKLVVWNVATGPGATRGSIRAATPSSPVRVEHPGGAVASVAFSPNGEWLAAASLSGTVFLWNTHTGQSEVLRSTPIEQIRSVAFSPTSDVLAAGEAAGKVVLWKVASGRELRTLTGYKNDVYALAFSPRADVLAAAGAGSKIVLWNLDDNDKVQATLMGHDPFIYSLAFNPGGTALAAAGVGDVELWNPWTQKQIAPPLTGQLGAVYGVAFSSDGQTLASGGADRTIRIWNYPPVRKYGVPLPPAHLRAVSDVAVARNGLIASGSADGMIYVIGGATKAPIKIRAPKGLHAVAFAEGGRILASAGDDGMVRLWDPLTGHLVGRRVAPGPHTPIFALTSDPNGTTLVSGDGSGNVRIWNVSSPGPVGPTLSGDLGAVFAVAFNPVTGAVAAGGNGRTIRIWHVERGRWVPSPAIAQDDALFALAFSPSGERLASGGADGTIRLWNLTSSAARTPKTLVGSSNFVRALAFSPDGKTLASGGLDQTVRLWDVMTATELGDPLTGDTGSVEGVAFSPGGRFLVTGSTDRTVRLWRAVAPPTSFYVLSTEVCTFLGAGLNAAEQSQYAPGLPFKQTCPRVTP